MGFNVERLAHLPVVLAVIGENFSLERDDAGLREQVRRLLDVEKQPVYYMLDFRAYRLNIKEVVMGVNTAAREPKGNFHHPNVEQVVFVTPSAVIKKVAQGLHNSMYGWLDVLVFDTVEDAFAAIAQQRRARTG